ncbi:MAG: hypothetical protein WBB07_17660 [Mycobacterium sp.]
MATLAGTPEEIIVDGEEYWQLKALLRVKKHWRPEDGVMVAFAPPGGVASFPALAQGAPGLPPTFREPTVVELDPEDPTPASLLFNLVTPGTAETAPLYDVELTIHRGDAGEDGTLTILTADDFDDTGAQAGYVLALKSDGAGGYNGVEAMSLKVGNMYWPTTINVLSNVSGSNALATVVIPAQQFGYRLCVEGQQIISPDGADVQVDLVARLGGTGTGDGSLDGLVIARGQGLSGGAVQNLIFSPSPPVGSTSGFGEVADGAGRAVFIRCEQVGSGTDTFDTVSGRGLFSVRVEALR